MSLAKLALYAVFSVLVCLGAGACSRKPIKRERTHVVVLSLDTLRSDSLRAYHARAKPHPTLDRIAARGHTFERAYSTASWTLPAHVSLFTGLYPDRHGVVDPRYAIGDASSFVEKLQASGYETVGFTDGGYVGAHYGFTRGFEIYDAWRSGKGSVSPDALPRGGKRAHDTRAAPFDRAIAFLKARHDARPLFLFVHTYAVHDYFRIWSPTELEQTPEPTLQSKEDLKCLLGTSSCSPERWKDLERRYEEGIDAVDLALKSLLDLIDAKLGLEHTVVVLLSDHGEGFDHARNRIHHGGRLHRDQLQIPLFVMGPGIESGRSTDPVSLVDVHPTILGLLGITAESNTDGRSLLPQLLQGSPAPPGAVWASEYYLYWDQGQRHNSSEINRSPISTARIDSERWRIDGQSGSEVYGTEDRRQLRKLVDIAEAQQPAARREVSGKPIKVVETMEVIEQLRALGYLE